MTIVVVVVVATATSVVVVAGADDSIALVPAATVPAATVPAAAVPAAALSAAISVFPTVTAYTFMFTFMFIKLLTPLTNKLIPGTDGQTPTPRLELSSIQNSATNQNIPAGTPHTVTDPDPFKHTVTALAVLSSLFKRPLTHTHLSLSLMNIHSPRIQLTIIYNTIFTISRAFNCQPPFHHPVQILHEFLSKTI